MQLRGAFRSSRAVLAVFLAVALVSSGLLGGLGWKLLQQDRELQKIRTDERIALAANALAACQPPGAICLTVSKSQVSVDAGAILYYPYAPHPQREAATELFEEGERFEYQPGGLQAAARAFRSLTTSSDAAVRAGALARLARVQRNSGAIDDALVTYGLLEQIEDPVTIDGIPPSLFARLGRASAFSKVERIDGLREEARRLESDLAQGRWQLSRAQYQAWRDELTGWLGGPIDDGDRIGHAEAVEWLWQNRDRLALSAQAYRPVESGQAWVAWSVDGERLRAGIAGPQYLASVIADVGVETAERQTLLATALVAIGLVLAAGWYFILRAIARERRSAQLQTDFLSAVSHEFRSPLTSMAHVSEMLETDRFPSDHTRRTAYGVLVRDTNRLRRLVEDLLDFRRFESGSAPLDLQPIDLGDLVRSLVADFEGRIAPAGYTIELNAPTLPIQIVADSDALSRALGNLLDNAIKYSPKHRTIWVDLARESGRVTISVRDRGIGIPLDEQPRIFDRFVRGAKPKALRIKGTGIGLAIVQHIVRAHGGEVQVESEPGKGTRFTIVLNEAAGAAA